MTQELIANHFRLPLFTSYNHLQIPFAYPPLAFYATAGLSQLFGWQLLDIFRIFPAVISILTIPAAHLLLKDLTEDDNLLSLAILIFSILPVTFDWAIMGGGVTRAPGFLFALLALHFTVKLFKHGGLWSLIVASLFLSIAILFHPETGFHTAVSVPVLWFFLNRRKKGVGQTALMALFTIILTSPWWGSVLQAHGLTPFLSAFATAEQHGNAFFFPLSVTITNELGTDSIAILALIGGIFFLAKKQRFLPVWAVISYTVAPRSAKIFISICVVIFAAYALELFIDWLDTQKAKTDFPQKTPQFLSSPFSQILLALLFLQWMPSSLRVINQYSYNKLTDSDWSAFTWIYENTDPNSKFLVLTNYFWSVDPVSEWFPVLAGRTSVATVQGSEWLEQGAYATAEDRAQELRYCTEQEPSCITEWALKYDVSYDFMYIRKVRVQNSVELVHYDSALVELLRSSPEYALVYESEDAAVFQRK